MGVAKLMLRKKFIFTVLFICAMFISSFVVLWTQHFTVGKHYTRELDSKYKSGVIKVRPVMKDDMPNKVYIQPRDKSNSLGQNSMAHLFTPFSGSGKLRIALLIPSTSRKIPKEEFFRNSSLTTVAIPSIEETMETTKYDYSIYVGIDQGDYLETIQPELRNFCKYLIPVVVKSTNFMECANGIAKRAYDDGADYFVRINDDTMMSTLNWTSLGVETLQSYTPPNVGMVGPTCHEGNQRVMTHDMVHRSHLQIFSDYYPQEFTDWWTDDWIDVVYRPIRSTQLANWTVTHKRTHGTRYWVNRERAFRMKLIDIRDKAKIMGFIYPKRQVVSFSLYGSGSRYLEGALANAKLMKTVYPDWIMRVYYDSTVPREIQEILATYEYVHLIEMSKYDQRKNMWRFLVASDPEVNVYVIRDIDARLSMREKVAVDDWLETDKRFHVMRDHPYHSHRVMPSGLWGGRKGAIHNIGQMMSEINFDPDADGSSLFMEYMIWPLAKESIFQHDSFSCGAYGPSSPFPKPRHGLEFVGSKYIDGKVDPKILSVMENAKGCS